MKKKVVSAEQRAKGIAAARKVHEDRKAAGRCRDCGANEIAFGSVQSCTPCLTAQAKISRERRQARMAVGLCPLCNGARTDGCVRCKPCRLKRSKWQKGYLLSRKNKGKQCRSSD